MGFGYGGFDMGFGAFEIIFIIVFVIVIGSFIVTAVESVRGIKIISLRVCLYRQWLYPSGQRLRTTAMQMLVMRLERMDIVHLLLRGTM